MEGYKTYRHETNPKEKELHDKFIKDFVKHRSYEGVISSSVHQISMPMDERGELEDHLSEREIKITISVIQWLGSPVGQSFLAECGFELKRSE